MAAKKRKKKKRSAAQIAATIKMLAARKAKGAKRSRAKKSSTGLRVFHFYWQTGGKVGPGFNSVVASSKAEAMEKAREQSFTTGDGTRYTAALSTLNDSSDSGAGLDSRLWD